MYSENYPQLHVNIKITYNFKVVVTVIGYQFYLTKDLLKFDVVQIVT